MLRRLLILSSALVTVLLIFTLLKQTPLMPDINPTTATSYNLQQADWGATIYGQRCITCHGDRGQGLAEWRLTWDEQHQNCSQPKCHGRNHPPEGFYMPVDAPAIIGTNTLTHFQNARQLFAFISASMPFQARGMLTPDEYWALTAYLLSEHGVLLNGVKLNAMNAESVSINPSVR